VGRISEKDDGTHKPRVGWIRFGNKSKLKKSFEKLLLLRIASQTFYLKPIIESITHTQYLFVKALQKEISLNSTSKMQWKRDKIQEKIDNKIYTSLFSISREVTPVI